MVAGRGKGELRDSWENIMSFTSRLKIDKSYRRTNIIKSDTTRKVSKNNRDVYPVVSRRSDFIDFGPGTKLPIVSSANYLRA